MIEVFNLEGMPVCKYRSEESNTFDISNLQSRGLPSGVYFVRMIKPQGTETARLLIH